MKGMIEGPNDSTYIKYYETTVKTIEEYKKSMDLFYEYRDRMVNVHDTSDMKDGGWLVTMRVVLELK